MVFWTIAVEGDSDVPVAAKILATFGHEVGAVYGLVGKGGIDKRLQAWCAAGRLSPWLILRDLDDDVCPPSLLARLRSSGDGMVRIAVREVEAWLLADREAAANWLGVSVARIALEPESLPEPKTLLVNLARQSRSRSIREDIVPQGLARHGPGYVDRIAAFCRESWQPERAARHAPSLRRCLQFVARRVPPSR